MAYCKLHPSTHFPRPERERDGSLSLDVLLHHCLSPVCSSCVAGVLDLSELLLLQENSLSCLNIAGEARAACFVKQDLKLESSQLVCCSLEKLGLVVVAVQKLELVLL